MTGPTDEEKQDAASVSASPEASPSKPEAKALSRIERLKQKVRKMQGKNPDIYPMR